MLLLNATSGQQAFCKHAVYDHCRMFFSLNSITFGWQQTLKLSLATLRGVQMMVSFLHLSFDWPIMSIQELLECWVCLSGSDRWTALMLIMYRHLILWTSYSTVPAFLSWIWKKVHAYWVNASFSTDNKKVWNRIRWLFIVVVMDNICFTI